MNQSGTLYFYQGKDLLTLKAGANNCSVLRGGSLPLAEVNSDIVTTSVLLLATDEKQSPLQVTHGQHSVPYRYTAYGHDPMLCSPTRTLLGFNGAPREQALGGYLLGNGYRIYRPGLRRFSSPDSWSPFGAGGLNAYAYCANDPVNYKDPTGHVRVYLANGQIMRVTKNQATPDGNWLKPSSPKRAMPLDSALGSDVPVLAKPSSQSSAKNGWQAPKTIQILGPTGDKVTDRVLEVVRQPGAQGDRVHIQESQLANFRYNQTALKYYKNQSQAYRPEKTPEGLLAAIKDAESKIEREVRFGKYLWNHTPSDSVRSIRN